MPKIKVSPLVFIFAAVMIAIGNGYALLCYFVAVFMHEIAHGEVARKRGYALYNIKIMPYGASLNGKFEGITPRDEAVIALCGPLCNVFIALVFTAVWWLVPSSYFFTEYFVAANVFTAVTNLLPVFPLDGGRAFLAGMSVILPRKKAYKTVRAIGFVFCIGFFALFVLSFKFGINPTFAFMGFFILFSCMFPENSAKYEKLYGMAYRSEKLKHGITVKEVMVADSLTLSELNKMLNSAYYYRFASVCLKTGKTRLLSENSLINCLTLYPLKTPLSELPDSVFCSVNATL